MEAAQRARRTIMAAMMVHVDNALTRAEAMVERTTGQQRLVHEKTAVRTRRLLRAAIRNLSLVATQEEGRFLVCDGKGDATYDFIGLAKGAGTSRGETRAVYRSTADGQLYFRAVEDFNKRMVLAGGGPALPEAPPDGQAGSLKSA